jgi:hypothetical protein
VDHQHDACLLRALGIDNPAFEHTAVRQLHVGPLAMTAGLLQGAGCLFRSAWRDGIVPRHLDLRAAAAAATGRGWRLSACGCLRRRRSLSGECLRGRRLHVVHV